MLTAMCDAKSVLTAAWSRARGGGDTSGGNWAASDGVWVASDGNGGVCDGNGDVSVGSGVTGIARRKLVVFRFFGGGSTLEEFKISQFIGNITSQNEVHVDVFIFMLLTHI